MILRNELDNFLSQPIKSKSMTVSAASAVELLGKAKPRFTYPDD